MKYIILLGLLITGCKEEVYFNTPERSYDKEIDDLKKDLEAVNKRLGAIELIGAIQDGIIKDLDDALHGLDEELESIHDALDVIKQEVIEVIYLCDDSEEVLFKTPEGYVAYFENGTQRYLNILDDGRYVTTDNSSCYFSILEGQLIKE